MPTGLYIHVPFCIKKCAYCDFYSVAVRPELITSYTRALLREIEQVGAVYPLHPISTVYFGGGTPSLLEPGAVAQVLDAVAAGFKLSPSAEITLEANPGSFGYEQMKGFRGAGINRISLGAQSFSEPVLRFLGRVHNCTDIYRGVENCRRAGFTNFNLDLIYGIPGQSFPTWEDNLRQAISLEPTHISAYLLQLESYTPLGQQVEKGELQLLPEEEELYQYEGTIGFLTGCGYHHYEISNFARAGYACQHNLIYWQGENYLGLGPGAVSYMGGRRYRNIEDVDAYIGALQRGQPPSSQELEVLENRALIQDRIILGLRLTEGIDCTQFEAQFGVNILSEYSGPLKRGVDADLLEIIGARVRLTKKGYFLSNEVFREFLG